MLILLLVMSFITWAAPEKDLVPIKVQTLIVANQDVTPLLKFPGVVQSTVNGKLSSEIQGTVTRITKTLGTKVRKGEIIFFVRNSQVGLNFNEYAVRSPVNGILSRLDVSVGQLVDAVQELGQVTDPDHLKIVMDVAAEDLHQLKVGLKSVFRNQENTITAVTNAVSPIVNPQTGTAPVELLIKDKATWLRPGLVGSVEVNLPMTQSILVPPQAVYTIGKSFYVNVMQDKGVVAKREIKLGALVNGQRQIISGLNPDETLIVRASDFIRDGDTVVSENPKDKKAL